MFVINVILKILFNKNARHIHAPIIMNGKNTLTQNFL